MKKLIKTMFRAAGYDVRVSRRADLLTQQERLREVLRAPPRMDGYLAGVIDGIFAHSNKKLINIVQIGANDGVSNDPLYHYVIRNSNRTRIVLIEPQPDLIPMLTENYGQHPLASVVNCAVGVPGSLTLYRIKPELQQFYRGIIGSGITSANREYVVEKAQKMLPKHVRRPDADDPVEAISVPCMPLSEIMAGRKLQDVDVLQCDVEGFDDEVLYSCDLQRFRPKLINYEVSHLSGKRMRRLGEFLDTLGYSRIKWSSEDECAIRG